MVLNSFQNRQLTMRAPDKWESARFTGLFLALSFSLVPGRVHARPLAGNANRWAAELLEMEGYP
jgi:hypothetical protein